MELIDEQRKVPITTTIPIALKKEIEKRNIKLQYVFIRGVESILGETKQSTRVQELEKKVERMATLLAALQRQK